MSDESGTREAGTGAKRFKLILKEEKVELEDANGRVKVYTIREMMPDELGQFRNEMRARTAFDTEGRPQGMKDYRGMEASLLAKCMYDSENKLVPITEFKSWPPHVLQPIYIIAGRINGLTDEGEDDAKNS